jgi:anti-sigma factor ChrR (cupin superfamily)
MALAAPTLQRSTAMDAVTPKGKVSADQHSHLVRPAEMEWQKTRFPGCEVKTLLLDRESGLMTAMFRFAPGAVLPDHEHVELEQSFVLEGSLEDAEGVATAGNYVWRPAGSRHDAHSPKGCVVLSFFLKPNKFFDTP